MSNQIKPFNFFGKNAAFEHIGIAVHSIRKEFKDILITADPAHKVNVAFIYIDNIKVELVEPLSENSPVSSILRKGQSLYHMCFRVPNINTAINIARKNGFHCISKILPGKAYNDNKVAWLFSKVYGLFELIEKD